jgi:SseB protein N-terminal domain
MFIKDLSPMPDATHRSTSKAIAVGWLEFGQPFSTGPIPFEFQQKLRELCMRPVRRTRGFHICTFCKNDEVQGNGEIDVPCPNAAVFIAPSLISHYADMHGYQPPRQFVEAVMTLVEHEISIGELSQRIMKVADDASPDNRNAFYEAFVKSRVGVRVPAEVGSVAPGKYVTTNENKLSVPIARTPDGKLMLLVLADVDRLAKIEAAATFIEFDAKDIMNMAVNSQAGIIVQAWLRGREAWAGIPEQDVVCLSLLPWHEIRSKFNTCGVLNTGI